MQKEPMEYQLDNSHSRYIRMTVTDLVHKKGLTAAISELMAHPDYPSKHALWDFTQAAMGLSMGDLREIAGVLRLYKTRKKNFANKSALVVPGFLDMSMARIYVSLSKLLPFDYRVFQTIDEALDFLTPETEKKN